MPSTHGFFISGAEKMSDYKADEYSSIEKALGITLSVDQKGWLDGFYDRPMCYPEGQEVAYLEAFGAGAADRRELEARHKD